MSPRLSKRTASILLASLAVGCGLKKELTLYDGPPLPKAQEVVLKREGITYFERVDGRPADAETVRLAPGPHTLVVYGSFNDGNRGYMTKPMSLAFIGEPGKSYVVSGLAIDSEFYVKVFPGTESRPLEMLPGLASGNDIVASGVLSYHPDRWKGTGSISGVVFLQRNEWFYESTTNQIVELLPKTPETAEWARRQSKKMLPGPLALISLAADPSYKGVPAELKPLLYSLRTSSKQGFTFKNVPAGTYYLAARDNVYGGAMIEVTVREGEAVKGIRLGLRQ